jgi:hypothetical protein
MDDWKLCLGVAKWRMKLEAIKRTAGDLYSQHEYENSNLRFEGTYLGLAQSSTLKM